MFIRVGYDMVFDLPAATPMVALLYTHPTVSDILRQPDLLHTEPDLPIHDYIDGFGNRCARFLAPAGRLRLTGDTVVEHSGLMNSVPEDLGQVAIEDLPDEVLQFLLASRYCEVDRLSDIAWNLFSSAPPGQGRVQAICDWVHNHVTFNYAHASHTKTAYDVYEEGRGVCRDYQHLAITFCRCLNIPARYATGWLGDHFVPPVAGPMDFSAWFEAYLNGQWWTFDARFNTPRVGHVLMARGRDAADCALTTSFGAAQLEKFLVWSDLTEGPELPLHPPTTGIGPNYE